MNRLQITTCCLILVFSPLDTNGSTGLYNDISSGIVLKNGSFEAVGGSGLFESQPPENISDLEDSLKVEAEKKKAQGEIDKKSRVTPTSLPILCWPPNLPPVMPANLKDDNKSSIEYALVPKGEEKIDNRAVGDKISSYSSYDLPYNYYNYLHNPYYWNPYMSMYGYNHWYYTPIDFWENNDLNSMMSPYLWYWAYYHNYNNMPTMNLGGHFWGGGTYDWYWSENWRFFNHGYRNGRWYGWRTYSGRFWNGRYFDHFEGWRFWDWRLHRNNGARGNWRYWGGLY